MICVTSDTIIGYDSERAKHSFQTLSPDPIAYERAHRAADDEFRRIIKQLRQRELRALQLRFGCGNNSQLKGFILWVIARLDPAASCGQQKTVPF